MIEDDLTHSHGLGCHLKVFILLDALEAFFEAHHGLRNDAGLLVGTRGADVGELLGLADVDDEVVVMYVLANHLSAIDFLTLHYQKIPSVGASGINRLFVNTTTIRNDSQRLALPWFRDHWH